MSKFRSLCVPLAAVTIVSGCSEATLPTPDPVVPSLQVYTGPVDPGGSSRYLFSLESASTVQVMLAGVIAGNPLRSLSPTMRLELSTWDGSDCVSHMSVDTMPLFNARLQAYFQPGSYCAEVTDIGELTESAAVTLRVVAPALVALDGEPGSRVFGSTITPGGSAATSFVASRKGRVTVALDAVSANAEVALALGIPPGDGRGCHYGEVVRATPGGGPHIDTNVDAGFYCVAIIDVGNLTEAGTFSLTVTHP